LCPLELIKQLPGEALAVSEQRRWVGVEAVRYQDQPPNEAIAPSLTHHWLLLFLRTPREFEAQHEGIRRLVPPPVGSILMVPAGTGIVRYTWGWRSDSLHVFLEPGLVARVIEEAFERDPARVSIPPLDGLHLPQIRDTMLAVNEELTADAGGDHLAVASLANVLAVHLARHLLTPQRTAPRKDGRLPRGKLRAVVEYVEDNLTVAPTLDQIAAIAHLSPYHFARQFKAAMGLSPYQYVISRRVERARELLRMEDLTLAEVAVEAGFSDQSQLCNHFKRLVGITPRQFRMSAGNA
jgi:AraC family transcriptional regulator